MNKTRPLRASNEFAANPKQVIDTKVIAAKKSVFRCRTISHNLAKWRDEKSRNAEVNVDAIAAA
tara:strand:- start:292 stop:483 length:192 start_codon:yes stop_codon:yes gene_type:complete